MRHSPIVTPRLVLRQPTLGDLDSIQAPRRRMVEKPGIQKLRVAHQAVTRRLDGAKLDHHEYIMTSPEALPDLHVSWS
jgi:hypothetical protein